MGTDDTSGQGRTKPLLSAGIVVMRWLEGKPHYLLLRANKYWDFPKGLVEPGENPVQAAIREVEEETTLKNLSFRWGRAYRETPPYRGGKVARYFVAESGGGEVSLPISPELGHPEHHEFRWATYGEACELVGERVRAILDWAHERVLRG